MPHREWRIPTGDGEGLLVRALDERKDGAATLCRYRATEEGERLGIPVELPVAGRGLYELADVLRVAADVRATTEIERSG